MDDHNTPLVCCPRHPSLRKLVGEFLQQSTLHGVKYLGAPNRHIIERCFWAIAVLIGIGVSVFLVLGIYDKYNKSPVIVSFQPMETSVADVPFPAITICNVNILKGRPVKKEVDVFNRRAVTAKDPYSDEMFQISAVKLEHASQYCTAAPSFRQTVNQRAHNPYPELEIAVRLQQFFDSLNETETQLVDEWKGIHRLRTRTFFKEASHDCEDMILKCMWARKQINCSDFFFNIKTRNGQCCVFNMMPQYQLRKMNEDDRRTRNEKARIPDAAEEEWKQFNIHDMIGVQKKWKIGNYPKYQMAGGKQYGLSLIVNPELSLYSSCTTNDGWGLKMVAHSPLSFPSILDYGMPINIGYEVFVDIEPQITVTTRGDISSIPIKKRGCLLPTDKDANLEMYNYYTSTNCMDECITKYIHKQCSCVRYYMPRNSSQTLCGAKKLGCTEKALENITSHGKSKKCPNCWPSCTDIKYRMQLSSFPLRQNANNFSYTDSFGNNLTATNYSILHMYIGTGSVYAKERKALYGAADLLANAGGLLSLTLGFSIISLVEIIYYCTLRPFFQLAFPGKEEDSDGDEDENDEDGNFESKKIASVFPSQNKDMDEYYDCMRRAFPNNQFVTKRITTNVKQKQGEMNDYQLFGLI